MKKKCEHCGLELTGYNPLVGDVFCSECLEPSLSDLIKSYKIVAAINRLTDSFNEKATELIVILKKLDKTYEYPYPEEKVWSNGSGVEGEQEAKSMFKETDCFGECTGES